MMRALAAIAGLFLALPVLAAEWAIDPSIEGRTSVTDNLNLTPGVRESVWWLSVSPAVSFSRNTELSSIAGSARVSGNRYPDDRELDTTDQFFTAVSKLQNERNEWGLTATYNRDSTLQTELNTTGIVQDRRQRALTTLAPSWQYSMTERGSVFANYSFEQARYEDDNDGLSNYTSQSVSAGAQYLWTENLALTLSGSYSRYETESGSQITNSNTVNAGFTYSVSERFNTSLTAGLRRSDIQLHDNQLVCPIGSPFLCEAFGIPLVQPPDQRFSDDGWVLSANAEYRWEASSAGLFAGRDVNPTGGGVLVQTDRIWGTYSRSINENLSMGVAASALQSVYLGGLDSSKNNYYRLEGNLSWGITEHWRLTTGYSYAYQKSEGAPEHGTANTVFLALGYNWTRISLPR